MKRAICIGAIATVIFGAGFVASDVLSTRRLTVTNDAGKTVVVATADAAGNGELMVFDSDGKQIFAVRGGKVYGAPTGTAKVDKEEKEAAKRVVKLSLISWRWHHRHGFAIAEGEVENVSTNRLENVRAVVTFRTKDGTFITYDSAMLDYNPLMPGETSPFEVIADWNPQIATADINFKYFQGGSIQWEEK